MKTFTLWLTAILITLVPIVIFTLFVVKRIKMASTRPIHASYNRARLRYAQSLSKAINLLPFHLNSCDGTKISCCHMSPKSSRGVVLVCHGYWQSKEFMYHLIEMLPDYDLVFFDFRAHGDSEGDQISFGVHEIYDVQAIYQWIRHHPDLCKREIYGLGVSMGGAILLHAAAQGLEFKKLIIDSVYGSFDRQLEKLFCKQTGLPICVVPVARTIIESIIGGTVQHPIESIEHIDFPVLCMHASFDDMVPVEAAHQLIAKAKNRKQLLIIPCIGHAKLHIQSPLKYGHAIKTFIEQA